MGESGKRLTTETKAKVMADLAAGHSIRQVVAEHRVSLDTASRLAKVIRTRTRALKVRPESPYVVRQIDDVSGALRLVGQNALLSLVHASDRLASMDLSHANSIMLRAHVSATRDLIETVKPFVMNVDTGAGLVAGEGGLVEVDGPREGEGEGVGESS